jgi:DNA-binding transcriptional ArsR family regulator
MTFSKTMQALADPTRRTILELLKKEDMPVNEIAKHFSISLPSLSHHLSVLKQSDLVTFQRQGQVLMYSLNLSVFEEVAKTLVKFFKKN